jgi:hypothetical protein
MLLGSGGTVVKAREDTILIPTYERGPEDPNPPLLMGRRNPIHPGSSIIYPYPLQETLFNRKADRKWRIFYLENEYLKLGILPELGGRLAFLFNKSTGEEAIYHNHVLKWARIGIRGAWVSGGIEWNFPNGHTVTSSCAKRQALSVSGSEALAGQTGLADGNCLILEAFFFDSARQPRRSLR